MKELLKVSYDNTTDEIEKSYTAFQNHFLLKKKIIYTVIYLIVIILAVDIVLRDPTAVTGYIAGGLSFGILVFNWIKPLMIRKRMINSLKQLGTDETYIMSLYEDRIEVETQIIPDAPTETVAITTHGIFPVEEGSAAAKKLEEHPELVEDQTKTEKTVYRLSDTELELHENNGLLILFVQRSWFHTVPRRCMGDEEYLSFKSYFEERALI